MVAMKASTDETTPGPGGARSSTSTGKSGAVPSPLTVAAGLRAHPHPGHGGAETTSAGLTAAAHTPGGQTVPAESVTGAQSLVRSLEALGVEVMFGIPGGA